MRGRFLYKELCINQGCPRVSFKSEPAENPEIFWLFHSVVLLNRNFCKHLTQHFDKPVTVISIGHKWRMDTHGILLCLSSFFSLMLEFQTVINEDLFNTNSSEVGAIIEAVISGIMRQQPGKWSLFWSPTRMRLNHCVTTLPQVWCLTNSSVSFSMLHSPRCWDLLAVSLRKML